MGMFIFFFQLRECGVGVYLGGREALVSQQLLYGFDFRSVVEHHRGKGMPQHMRAFLFLHCHHRQVFPDRAPHLACPIRRRPHW